MRRKRKTTVAAILAAVLGSLSLTAVTAFAEPGDGGGGMFRLFPAVRRLTALRRPPYTIR